MGKGKGKSLSISIKVYGENPKVERFGPLKACPYSLVLFRPYPLVSFCLSLISFFRRGCLAFEGSHLTSSVYTSCQLAFSAGRIGGKNITIFLASLDHFNVLYLGAIVAGNEEVAISVLFLIILVHAFLVLRAVCLTLRVMGGGLLVTAVTMLYGQQVATQVL